MNDVKNLITHLLEYATKQGADLHICPKSAPFVRLGKPREAVRPTGAGRPASERSEREGGKYGELEQVPGFDDCQLDMATVKALIGELLTPEQKAELQKNKCLDFPFTYGELGRFRAYAYTQRGTHAITIHTLPFDVPDFYKLGLSDAAVGAVENIVMGKTGLIIVAGDYFSEKSKTLAALVDLINQKRNCHISTAEKPIEYLHHHKKAVVAQKEIGADIADFKTALEQIQHENPDVLAVSELRQEYLLSVMELSEERLVLANVKTNYFNNECATSVMQSIMETARDEAGRRNLIYPFIPLPCVNIIYQESRPSSMRYELLTWEMYGRSKEKDYKTIKTEKRINTGIDPAKIRELKIQEQKKAVRAGYDMDVVPFELK